MSRITHHPVRHTVHHLALWQRLSLYTVGALLLLTGLVWLGVHYVAGAGAGELPHPLEPWLMRLHGLAAFASLFMLGVMAAAHLPHGWRLSRRHRWAHQRRTGVALCSLASIIVLSGYLLYYFAPESLRPLIGWVHAVAGMAMATVLASHRRSTRRAGELPSVADVGSSVNHGT